MGKFVFVCVFLFTFAGRLLAESPSKHNLGGLGFAGSCVVADDGQLEFKMDDGSILRVSPAGVLGLDRIGREARPVERYDAGGRILLAADHEWKRVYAFQYDRRGALTRIVDPEAMVIVLGYDGGRLRDVFFPRGPERRLW